MMDIRKLCSRSDLSAQGRFSPPIFTCGGAFNWTLARHVSMTWVYDVFTMDMFISCCMICPGVGAGPGCLLCFKLFAAIQRGPVVVSIAAAARLQLVGSQPCSVAMCVVCYGDPSTNYSSKHCRGRWVANITRRCAFEIMHNHWESRIVISSAVHVAVRVPHRKRGVTERVLKRNILCASCVSQPRHHCYFSNSRRKFRSQTSDNMDRWKAEQGRGREKRKIRREKSRRERVRRKKMQMREKVGKSRNTVFFRWFGAPEGRKVGWLKRRVRSQLARWEMKNCTPLWREAHFEVKMYKTLGVRTTFGGSDVASPLRFTTLHYVTLHHIPLHYTTLHYTPQHYNYNYTTRLHSTTLHYIKFHYTTLHYTTLHYTTLHYIRLHYTPLHYITLHYTALHNTTTTTTQLHSTTLHYTKLHYTTLHYTPLHYTPLHYTTLHYTTFHYTSLHDTTLHSTTLQLRLHNYTPLHEITLHYITLHYTTFHYTTLHYTTIHWMTLHHR